MKSDLLIQQLEKASRKASWLLIFQTAGYLAAVGLAVNYLLLIYAYFFPQYLFFRWDLRLGGLIFLGLFAVFSLGIILRRWNNIQWLTQSAEKNSAGWGGRLSTAVETLSVHRESQNPYTRIFADGLKQEVQEELQTFDWNRLLGLRRALLPFALAFFFVFVSGVHAALAPGFFTRAYQLLSPVKGGQGFFRHGFDSNLAPFQIEVKPGHCEVPMNGSMMIQARIRGDMTPQKVELYVRPSGKLAWNVLAMRSKGSNFYDYLVSDIHRDAVYFVQADGRQSEVFNIRVSRKFAMEQVTWEVTPPAYIGTPPQRKQGWVERLTVPEGSLIKASFKFNRAVQSGSLLSDDGGSFSFYPAAQERQEAIVAVQKNQMIKISATSDTGETLGELPPVWIQTVPDLEPFVEVLEPQIQNYVFATEEVPFNISVNDDYGIQSAELVLQFKGKKIRLDILPEEERGNRELKLKPVLAFENYDLSSRDIVFAYIEIQDSYPGERPQIARSPLFTFMIRDFVEQYKLNLPASEQPSFRSLFEDLVHEQSEITREVWDYLSFLQTERPAVQDENPQGDQP